jgi:hypothetical protein
MTIGVLLQFANDAAIIGIAVLLFPVLKGYGEGMALLFSRVRHPPGAPGSP